MVTSKIRDKSSKDEKTIMNESAPINISSIKQGIVGVTVNKQKVLVSNSIQNIIQDHVLASQMFECPHAYGNQQNSLQNTLTKTINSVH